MQRNPRLNTWWIILLQGIATMILGYFVFTRPLPLYRGLVSVLGYGTLALGLLQLVKLLFIDSNPLNWLAAITSGSLISMGIFLLLYPQHAASWIKLLLSVVLVINALQVTSSAWEIRKTCTWWWLSVVLLLFSVMVGYLLLTGLTLGHLPTASLMGSQLVLTGILLLSFVYYVYRYHRSLQQLAPPITHDSLKGSVPEQV